MSFYVIENGVRAHVAKCVKYARTLGCAFPIVSESVNPVSGDVVICYNFGNLEQTISHVRSLLERWHKSGVRVIEASTGLEANETYFAHWNSISRIKPRGDLLDEFGGVISPVVEKPIKTTAEFQADWLENSIPSRWIDTKIVEKWTTEKIVREFNFLYKLMPTVFKIRGGKGGVSKHYVNMRRLFLTR